MCSSTVITMPCAIQRCMLRISMPKRTFVSSAAMSVYARSTDGHVVEHQQDAGDGEAEEHEEAQAAEAVGVRDLDVRLVDARRVQVQEDVRRDDQHLVARGVRVAGAEDRLPDVVVEELVVDEVAEARALWLLCHRHREPSRPSATTRRRTPPSDPR